MRDMFTVSHVHYTTVEELSSDLLALSQRALADLLAASARPAALTSTSASSTAAALDERSTISPIPVDGQALSSNHIEEHV